jgi:hypothetical protein
MYMCPYTVSLVGNIIKEAKTNTDTEQNNSGNKEESIIKKIKIHFSRFFLLSLGHKVARNEQSEPFPKENHNSWKRKTGFTTDECARKLDTTDASTRSQKKMEPSSDPPITWASVLVRQQSNL